MPDIGNEFWGPSLQLSWRPKKDLYEKITCSCQSQGNFFNIYGEHDICPNCNNQGYTIKRIEAPKPEWPDDYVKYMSRCHNLYLKRTRKFRG